MSPVRDILVPSPLKKGTDSLRPLPPQSLNGSAVLLPFQIHRLKVLVEAGLVAFSSACFEFANEVPKEAPHSSLAHLPKVFSSHLHDLSKVVVVRLCA